MKRIKLAKISVLLFAVVMLWNCEKDAEIQPKTYPYVYMTGVQPDQNAVIFKAVVQNYNKFDIESCGFYYGVANGLLYNAPVSVTDESFASNGRFERQVGNKFNRGVEYVVVPYVKLKNISVDDHALSPGNITVYGPGFVFIAASF